MSDEELARRMMRRFLGFDKAYGSYDHNVAKQTMVGGKLEIKSTAFTKRKLVTLELWLDHIHELRSLGIIPIRDNNTCVWGCIDIDQYGVDIVELIKRIRDEEFPLIVCGSKSGGAHLFLFIAEPVPAIQMQFRLSQMAAYLGYGGSEIFPKQSAVQLERGDLGSWLNMPYFGKTRWAYRDDGTVMPLADFLDLADSLEQPVIWFDTDVEKPKKNDKKGGDTLDFGDGPPCMQHLSALGIGKGYRNSGIMSFGIYAKKKFGTRWKEVLEQWNRDICMPPLPSDEMADIIARLSKKDYYYPCKDQPIVAHCNSALCRTRRYGVASGTTNEVPVIGGLSVLYTTPPLWFLDVNGHRIELTSDELFNFNAFQKVCGERLLIYFQQMTRKSWGEVLSAALNEVNQLEVTADMGWSGQFIDLLDDFVNNKQHAKVREEILMGLPWLDDQGVVLNVNGKPMPPAHYFRLRDLKKFLDEANFKIYTTPQLTTRIKELKGGTVFFKIKDTQDKVRGVNVWWVPADFAPPMPTIPTRDIEDDPI